MIGNLFLLGRTLLVLVFALFGAMGAMAADAKLRAGAAVVDISPRTLPAIRNGGFLETQWSRVADPLFARCLVLDDGRGLLAIAIVDSCMLPTAMCDKIKQQVAAQTTLQPNRILIAATHTHSAPAAMMCLGARPDPAYAAYLAPQIAKAIQNASENLHSAKIGWTNVNVPELTNCRRWIRRSDQPGRDPFGQATVRAMMHPGHQNPAYSGPAGPIDPQLSLLSVVTEDGQPLCLLANYSMHYFGSGSAFSADYFGDVVRQVEAELADPDLENAPRFVAIQSQGTSGDLHWMDYSRPASERMNRQQYSAALAKEVLAAYRKIEYHAHVPLAMAERRIMLKRRTPSKERLKWAQEINEARGARRPNSRPEVYAEQSVWMHEHPTAEVVLQAVRIGELGIATFPNEVYGITGLKIKRQSPLPATFNIELANGAEGYIPPPEQHELGGYTTWPASTAGLEVQAEPIIVETLLSLLEEVSGRARRPLEIQHGPYAKAVLADRPVAYWRCEDIAGHNALDSAGQNPARYEPGIARYLSGARRNGAISAPAERPSPFSGNQANHAVHFAGGRLRAKLTELNQTYTASFWFWNGLDHAARPVTGYLFSRGADGDKAAAGEHLGIGGTSDDVPPGRLFFYTGDKAGQVIPGKSPLTRHTWYHVVLVRDGEELRVYLDGQPEITAQVKWTIARPATLPLFLGGRCDSRFGLEGKIDEVALFDRALTADQVEALYRAARQSPASRAE